jgi:hypothetical protein
LAFKSLPRYNKGQKGEVLQYRTKISTSCLRTCLWHAKRTVPYNIQEDGLSQAECYICYHGLYCITHFCIKRHDSCLPCWQLKVKKLQLIRKPTKRVTDKKLFETIRVRLSKWLWSLRS